MDFPKPSVIPQDLLLIHELVGVSESSSLDALPSITKNVDVDDEASSDGGVSVDEVAGELYDSDSSSDGPSDSDMDSDSSSELEYAKESRTDVHEDDLTEPGPSSSSQTYFKTANELSDVDVRQPDIAEVGNEEVLEPVGKIISVVDRTVIIQGNVQHASGRVLDSESILAFDDRMVLGYVFETFGPTLQPMYQVKLPKDQPIPSDKVYVSREVYNVVGRSRFIFVNQLRQMKGSDASNVHDEEPGEDEIEFSDDEAETAYRASLKKRRRSSRASSVVSTHSDSYSQMRDQDMGYDGYTGTAFDKNSPYDMDYGLGTGSLPYDDPYTDAESNANESVTADNQYSPVLGSSSSQTHRGSQQIHRGRGRSAFRGRGERHRGRGRGRFSQKDPRHFQGPQTGPEASNGHTSRSMSPTSLAIARVTGQQPNELAYDPSTPHFMPNQNGFAGFQQQQQFQSYSNMSPTGPMNVVQPHINPLFAAQFGFRFGAGGLPNQFGDAPESHYDRGSGWSQNAR